MGMTWIEVNGCLPCLHPVAMMEYPSNTSDPIVCPTGISLFQNMSIQLQLKQNKFCTRLNLSFGRRKTPLPK